MKIVKPLLIAVIVFFFASCATVFGGKVGECQRSKPKAGQPSRAIRPVPLIANILFFWPGIAVDFATCAAYKPCAAPVEASAAK
jgi:hypothetical protein